MLQYFLLFTISISCAHSTELVKSNFINNGTEVCFDNLGCFGMTDCPVTGKWLKLLPDKPSNINTTFTVNKLVSTNNDWSNITNSKKRKVISVQRIHYDDVNSLQAINGSERLAFVIHGFGKIGGRLQSLKKVLVDVVPQVILVNWQRGSRVPFFNYAVVNTQVHNLSFDDSITNGVITS